MGEWFEDAFRDEYLLAYAARDDLQAAAEVRAWIGRLPGFEAGARTLDLACGAGRHLRVMRGEGMRAAGLDLSPDLVEEAERRGTGGLVRGDMRRLPFRGGAFSAVTSFFSSFGYFRDEADDAAVLREIARVLAPGGGLLLDLMDPETTRRDLVPSTRRDHGRIREDRWITRDGRRVEKEVRIESPGGRHAWIESVRLYEPAEIEALAAAEGLRPRGRFAGHGPEPWRSGATPRCVLVFEKAAS